MKSNRLLALSAISALCIPLAFNQTVAADGLRSGLAGVYFGSPDFKRPQSVHILRNADIQWGRNRGRDWSAKWCGLIKSPFTGTVKFVADFADGLRLTIADKLVIDALDGGGQHSGEIEMQEGVSYPIVVAFSSRTGKAALRLSWQWNNRQLTVIPGSALSYDIQQLPDDFRRVFFTVTHPPAGPDDPVRYAGTEIVAPDFSDGRLRPAVGVQNRQVFRCNRTHPELADGSGYTYHHAPNLAYWKGKFYLQHLSTPVHEHQYPCHTLLTTSKDGINWGKPKVIFPAFDLPDGTKTIAHQRMGFYVSSDDRLLVLAFYGKHPVPNDGMGIGRAVREIHEDGSLGPIYFIRYNYHAGWDERRTPYWQTNVATYGTPVPQDQWPLSTPYPFYKNAQDEGFIHTCDELLSNKLIIQQWWEEDRSLDGFYPISGGETYLAAKAFCFYHRPDGKVVGLWKRAFASISSDEGHTWNPPYPVHCKSFVTGGAKNWGQRTEDGRYTIVYNPQYANRWPLVAVTSDDGIAFDDMLTVHGEVPARRFFGVWKDLGPQYVRGIIKGNGDPPGTDMWLTYSMNKEDIWVSSVPVPILGEVDNHVKDTFDDMAVGREVAGWNVYSPLWAPVSIATVEGTQGNCLRLFDKEPYDYARAVRVFPERRRVRVSLRVMAERPEGGRLEIELTTPDGSRPVRIALTNGARIEATDGEKTVDLAGCPAHAWIELAISADTDRRSYDVSVNGQKVLKNGAFAEPAGILHRLSLRTGPFRRLGEGGDDKPNSDNPVSWTAYYIDNVFTADI
jgi:hypothetical protein